MIRLTEQILNSLYPNRCLSCDRILPEGNFCKECSPFLAIEEQTCRKCGLPKNNCRCKWYFYYFDELHAPFENEGSVKQAFYRYKFGGLAVSANYFANEMAAVVNRFYDVAEIDYITAVPTHYSTRLERGYDHTARLARSLGKALSIPFRSTLCQPRKSAKQHEANGVEQRFDNVREKYRLCRRVQLKDKTVLLVDDIVTTGATLSACARLLKLAGAKEVYAVSALITFLHSTKKKEQD